MLWMGKKSVDQQVADHGNDQQSTKTRDTSDRIVLVKRINCYWLKKTMTHCIVNAQSQLHYCL
jgi:hypothetical protein